MWILKIGAFLLCINFYVNAEQFIYPIAAIDQEGQELLVIYQKSLEDISLWIWNSHTKHAIKGLLSTYTPAGVKMLPSGVGFSFMDDGRLRIKHFYKRSPKTIALYQPLTRITDIHWISDDAFYFSAQEGKTYNIYSSNTLGEVQRCTASQDVDYLYPCKVNNFVFCITRTKDMCFKIVKIKWQLYDFDSEEVVPCVQEILLETRRPLSYLYMHSESEGYYLDYSAFRNNFQNLQALPFSCFRIFKNEENKWEEEYLFDFSIPYQYVIGKEEKRLYESIMPLLPCYINSDFIYFMDSLDKENLVIKEYCKKTKSIQEVNASFKSITKKILSPLPVKNNLYVGFVIDGQNKTRILDLDGSLYIDLPNISITHEG